MSLASVFDTVYLDDTVYGSKRALTEKTIPTSSGRMGRPPLGNKATQVRLSDEARARIEALCGKRGMAQFIRDAVDEKLERSAPQKPQQPPPPSSKPRTAGRPGKAASEAPAGSGGPAKKPKGFTIDGKPIY